jgi:hypothetical protein
MQNDTKAVFRVLGGAALLQLAWLPVAVVDRMERSRVSQPFTPASPTSGLRQAPAPPPQGPTDGVLSALLLNPSSPSMSPPAAVKRMGASPSDGIPTPPPGTHAAGSFATALAERLQNTRHAAPAAGEPFESFRDHLGIVRPGTPAGFSTADLLGGPLTLASSAEVAMPVLARAERARWASSGDPLAPLPAQWRTPMRQAVKQLTSTGNDKTTELSALVVHIPSTRVRRMEQVPVAIRDDGTATVLRAPNDKAAIKEIEGWAAKQPVPNQGAVATALVTIHPMPDVQTVRPLAEIGNSARARLQRPPAQTVGVQEEPTNSIPAPTPLLVEASAPLP